MPSIRRPATPGGELPLLGHLPMLLRVTNKMGGEPVPAMLAIYNEHVDRADDTLRLAVPQAGDGFWLTANADHVEKIIADTDSWGKITHTEKRGPIYSARTVVKDALFTASDTEVNWGKAHRVLMPAFSPSGLAGLAELTVRKADSLLERLAPGQAVDIGKTFTGLTFDIIGSYVGGPGLDFGTTEHPERMEVDPFLVAMDVALNTKDLGGDPLFGPLHRKRWASRVEAIATLHKYAGRVVEERKALLADKAPSGKAGGRPCVLDLMLSQVDSETGETMDEDNVRANLILFLLVGHDSTSSLLTSLVYVLTQHPEVEERLRREVEEVIGLSGTPTADNIKKLSYMTAVIKETLRLYPPAAALSKTALKDGARLGPYSAAAGTKVIVNLNALHRNPKLWGDNAEAFDPSRFLPGAPERHAYSWVPFSSGPRACLGMQFALIEARVVLSRLLQRKTFRLHADARVKPGFRTFMKLSGVSITAHDISAALPPAVPVQLRQELASMLSREVAPAAKAQLRIPKHGGRMALYYGSNMGTCKALADGLAAEAEAAGFEVALAPLNGAAISADPACISLIVTSTYNGLPPENAKQFAAWLAGLAPGSLAGARVGVMGVGNSNWKSYQAFPAAVEAGLKAAGASLLCGRGAGDEEDDLDAAVASWRGEFWPAALAAVGQEPGAWSGAAAELAPPRLEVRPAPAGAEAMRPAREAGYGMATVLAGRELQADHSGRSTRHVELQLPEGMAYQEGDHLAVLPCNQPALVLEAAALLGAELGQLVQLADASGGGARGLGHLPLGCPVRVSDLLSRHVDLQAPVTPAFMAAAAAAAEEPEQAAALEELAAALAAGGYKLRPLQVLRAFPSVRLPLAAALALLAPMKQRYYSISSSPAGPAGGRVASVTVGLVEGETPDLLGAHTTALFRGVASGFLGDVQPGQLLEVTVVRNERFRLPAADQQAPVIMIGPGTGLAPFRGFVQALQAAGRQQQAMLLFGCRSEADYIYRAELEAALAAGALNELLVAFSRKPDTPKQYVQDLLWEARERVWPMMQAGGYVYVCGDARHMAKDVDATLVRIARDAGGLDSDAADAFVRNMSTTNRYLQDVWAN